MTDKPSKLRIAAAALFVSVAFPATPGLAQDVPTVTPPPPVVTAPPVATPPPPVAATPPVTQPQPRPPVQLAPRPPVAGQPATPPVVDETRPVRQRTSQRAERPAPRVRAEAPAPRAAAPAPEPVVEPALTPAVPPEAVAPAPLPPAVAPEPVPVEPAAPVDTTSAAPIWPWLAAGAALVLMLIAFLAFRRRRTQEEYYQEAAYAAPTYETPAREAPVATSPAVAAAPLAAQAARVEEAEISAASDRDVAALNAGSAPVGDRPWLEFLMRPVRAGTNGDEARVEFELTVGNTGSVPAREVRISTWMIAADQATEMERSLIEPPADAQRSEVDIPAGDGARVEGAISVPTEGLRGKVLPVVVADARYRLPDGSEGRTSASFAVGLPNGEGLEPFAIDLPSGLHDDVEARLHSEPQRV
jgi:hypothetical protein